MKAGLTEELIALIISKELKDGMYVNLGVGIPTLIHNCVPPRMEVIIHTESGILGCGPIANQEQQDKELINAGVMPITIVPGASFFDATYAFGIMRGGHIDLTVLGAYQVSETGDLANVLPPEGGEGTIGGAMDVVCGAKRVFVAMKHVDRHGNPRILNKCTMPITATRIVSKIFTDLAVIEVTGKGLLLKETAPGFTAEEIQNVTGARLSIDPQLITIEF